MYKHLWKAIFAIFTSYFVTFLIFPALIMAVPCYRTKSMGDEIYTLVILTIYYFADGVSRLLIRVNFILNKVFKTMHEVAIMAGLRVLQIILYFLMALPKANFEEGVLPLLRSDALSYISIFVLGFTNGLTSSLVFVKY